MPFNYQRPAMIFAHHPHEVLVTGMLHRLQPHLLFLTVGNQPSESEESIRAGLASVGFEGSARFFSLTEQDIYPRLIAGDHAWVSGLRDEIADWLAPLNPDVIFTDAWEGYHPLHDLAPLLARSAIQQNQQRGLTAAPHHLEILLEVHSLDPEPLSRWYQSHISECWRYELTAAEVQAKRAWFQRILENTPPAVSDHPEAALERWTEAQFQAELYRPVPRNRSYRIAPPAGPWQSYDEHGRQRVAEGRYEVALTFAEHMAPLAATLEREFLNRSGHPPAA